MLPSKTIGHRTLQIGNRRYARLGPLLHLSVLQTLFVFGALMSSAGEFVVRELSDSGPGSLRQAILDSNGSGAFSRITFALPGTGPFVIRVGSPLPSLNVRLEIDGTTQTGYSNKPLIHLLGTVNAGHGLEVKASDCTLRGLSIGGFNYGVVLYGDRTKVERCFIGTLDGETPSANRGFGMVVFSGSNRIGGVDAEQRNVISGNTLSGLDIEGESASDNEVYGNYVGLNSTGTRALGNEGAGILVYGASGTTIGGSSSGKRNWIGGNRQSGVEISAGSTASVVSGNFIGTDVQGQSPLGNRGAGVLLSSASANWIGSGEPGAGNLISGNLLSGVNLNIHSTFGGSTEDNHILGNLIGTRADGLQALPNFQAGILVFGSIHLTWIGGLEPGEGNVISGNRLNGIELFGPTTDTQIVGNRIGVDITASKAIPNAAAGVLVTQATHTRIGSTNNAGRNIISGNGLSGIEITGNANENSILGNWIGIDASGTNPIPNQEAGVLLSSASRNRVGGPGTGEGNVLSGNGLSGINLNVNSRYGSVSEDNVIQGNVIGASPDGQVAVGNLQAGILAFGEVHGTLVGGEETGTGNLISGNKVNGIELNGSIQGTAILGNIIGLSANRLDAMPNDSAGILLSGFDSSVPSDTLIGNGSPFAANWISGNRLSGIEIRGRGANNQISGNQIGTALVSTIDTGNNQHGIFVSQETDPAVPLEGLSITDNVIAFNGLAGVFVGGAVSEFHPNSTGINIRRNAIYANQGLAIGLGEQGPQANDSQDSDQGPNDYQNYPELSQAVLISTGLLEVEGEILGPQGASDTIDFYLTPSCPASGSGEGRYWVGTASVKVASPLPENFHASFPIPLELGSLQDVVLTATSTDSAGNTSEFSPCLLLNVIQGSPRITQQPFDAETEVNRTARFQVLAAGKPPLQYQWFVDGQPASEGSSAVFLYTVTNALSRRIFVTVSNAQGGLESRTVTLRVVPAGGAPDALSDIPRRDLWLPNGEVKALAVQDGALLLGGHFDSVSPPSSGAALVDRLDASLERPFPFIEGVVRCVAQDDQGGLFVGGQFSSVDGVQRSNLVHLLSDHSVDLGWQAFTDAEVLTMGVISNRLHIGGRFTVVNGQHRSALAAVSIIDGGLLSWVVEVHVSGEPIASPVAYAIQTFADRVFASGDFGVIAIDGAQPSDSRWRARLDRGNAVANGIGSSMTLGPSGLYVAGEFERVNGVFRTNLVALDRTTGAVLDWDATVDGPIHGLEYVCDSVVLAGDFQNVNQVPRNRLAVLDPRNAQLLPWSLDVDGPIEHLSSMFNTLYIAGSFQYVGPESRHWIAAIDYSSATTLTWHANVHQPPDSILPLGRSVLLGAAVSVPVAVRRNFAAIDLRTGKPLPWLADCDAPVRTLTVSNQGIFLGGDFTTVNEHPHKGLAVLDPVTHELRDWNPSISGSVQTLAVSGETLYVGGDFVSVNGSTRNNLAALDVNNGSLRPWNPRVISDEASPIEVATVNSVTVGTRAIYISGRFDHVGDVHITDLAALDPESAAVLPWNPVQQVDPVDKSISSVRQVIARDGTVWVAGDFLRSPTFGDWRGGLASFDDVTGALLAWNPSVSWSTDLPFEVRTLAFHSGAAYAGGHFGWVYGLPRSHLASIRKDGVGQVLPWSPPVDDTVNVLLSAGNQLVVGGRFKSIGGHVLPYLASFQPRGAPVIRKQSSGGVFDVGTSIHLSTDVDGLAPLSFQWLKDGQPVQRATNASLDIGRAEYQDSGVYQLIVTNSYGNVASREVHLQVVEPVQIIEQPLGGRFAAGTPVTLRVVASGNPSPIYQWRLNGVNIPGADRATYSIPNGDPTSGGNYSVIVANPGRAIRSEIATIVFSSPSLPFADQRVDAGLLEGRQGVGSTQTETASREVGEPLHAGKFGGKSIWARWIAPADGVATFSSRGSTFDTLLAIYTNGPSRLARIADDEDRGGFTTSLTSFNAIGGQEYWIAVDGFSFASGDVVVTWGLNTATIPFPKIITQPLSQTASPGETVFYSVTVATSPTPVRYQWMKDCVEIPDATNALLTLTQVGKEDVGVYAVRIRNGSSLVAESDSVLLELANAIDVVSQDKVQDLFRDELSGGVGPRIAPQGTAVAGWIPVSMGLLAGKTVNNFNASTQEREPIHCAVIGGASKWFRLRGEIAGELALDTIGSSFDTVVAVYTLPHGGALTNIADLSDLNFLRLVACDDDGAPDRQRSALHFAAQPGTDYLVAVDGVGAAQGKIQLNWQLGQIPLLSTAPSSSLLKLGGQITLRAATTNVGPQPRYEWRLNHVPLAGATNPIWEIRVLKSGLAGTYEVTLSNVFGVTTNIVAEVGFTLAPLQLTWDEKSNGRSLRVWYPESAPEPLAIEESIADLQSWRRANVFTPTNSTLVWEALAEAGTHRFFRVLPAALEKESNQ